LLVGVVIAELRKAAMSARRNPGDPLEKQSGGCGDITGGQPLPILSEPPDR